MIIGVDESGTGAWAGPFTVVAAAMDETTAAYLRAAGVRDSKKLSDQARRRMFVEIADTAHAVCEYVSADQMKQEGHGTAWRRAVIEVIKRLTTEDTTAKIVIDGLPDSIVARTLSRVRPHLHVRFMPKADDRIVAVGAASVVAKTLRNDAMIKLHAEYPAYGWERNFGYGTEEHRRAIKKHGTTPVHRQIKYTT
jgi:ribonuclease HII